MGINHRVIQARAYSFKSCSIASGSATIHATIGGHRYRKK
jgi:hypothetical protein